MICAPWNCWLLGTRGVKVINIFLIVATTDHFLAYSINHTIQPSYPVRAARGCGRWITLVEAIAMYLKLRAKATVNGWLEAL